MVFNALVRVARNLHILDNKFTAGAYRLKPIGALP